jgi:hypothetical protein
LWIIVSRMLSAKRVKACGADASPKRNTLVTKVSHIHRNANIWRSEAGMPSRRKASEISPTHIRPWGPAI